MNIEKLNYMERPISIEMLIDIRKLIDRLQPVEAVTLFLFIRSTAMGTAKILQVLNTK
jgi:hypothetical protein